MAADERSIWAMKAEGIGPAAISRFPRHRSLGVERFSSWAGLADLGSRSSFSLPRLLKLDHTLRRLRLTSNSERKKCNNSCFVAVSYFAYSQIHIISWAPEPSFHPRKKEAWYCVDQTRLLDSSNFSESSRRLINRLVLQIPLR